MKNANVITVMCLLVALFFSVSPNFATAQEPNNRGIDGLGLCSTSFPCENILGALDKGGEVKVGWLDNTFAADCKCGDKILAMPKPKVIRVHASNGTCFPERGRRCESFEVWAGENEQSAENKVLNKNPQIISRFKARLAFIASQLQKAKPPVKCYISPTLESTFKKPARKILADIAVAALPQCTLVDSTMGDGPIPGALWELHGSKPFAQTGIGRGASLDGATFQGTDMVAFGLKYTKEQYLEIWDGCLNGNKEGVPYKNPRTRVDFCSGAIFRQFGYWVRPQAVTAQDALNPLDKAGCKQVLKAADGNKNFVWKLGAGRPYAVMLAPKAFKTKFKSVTAWKNGKAIDSGKFRGLYGEDKTNRQIWDFSKHPVDFPDNVVIHADSNCWVLQKPQWRID